MVKHDDMISSINSSVYSSASAEPLVEPPVLHLFGIEPDAQRYCFNRSIVEEPPREKLIPFDILDDLQTIRDVRAIVAADSTELGEFQNDDTITNIQKLRDMTSLALKRLQVTDMPPGTSSAPLKSPVIPRLSPNAELSEEIPPTPRNLRARIQATDRGVVHGTGVVSKQWFKKHDFITLYHGPLVYRLISRQHNDQQKFHVFRLEPGKSCPVPKFLEKDTFAAWSNVFIKYSGIPGIEIGRDAVGPIRYLNHSKDANVKITSHIVGRLAFNECEKLLLRVIALKDINPGEELLFDYDPSQPQSMIDFTLSTVEKPDKKQMSIIRHTIRKISRKAGVGQIFNAGFRRS